MQLVKCKLMQISPGCWRSHQRHCRVEQSPLKGGEDGGAWVQDLDESRLEELVAIEGHIPEEPRQGAASQPMPVVVPEDLLLTQGDLHAMITPVRSTRNNTFVQMTCPHQLYTRSISQSQVLFILIRKMAHRCRLVLPLPDLGLLEEKEAVDEHEGHRDQANAEGNSPDSVQGMMVVLAAGLAKDRQQDAQNSRVHQVTPALRADLTLHSIDNNKVATEDATP